MSQETKTLKQQNTLQIGAYITINILIFWALMTGIELNIEASESILGKVITSAFWSLLVGALTTILNGQISSDIKYILIFWRLKNPLPACRAFSNFMNQDPRIDPEVLKTKLVTIPTEPIEQNRRWYKIYKKHEDKRSVLDAHKKFLLTRELTGLSFLFLIVLAIVGILLFQSLKIWAFYVAGLCLMFLLTSQAARNYGARLVTNVLAEETSE